MTKTEQDREIAEALAPLIAVAETGEQWAEICRLEQELLSLPSRALKARAA